MSMRRKGEWMETKKTLRELIEHISRLIDAYDSHVNASGSPNRDAWEDYKGSFDTALKKAFEILDNVGAVG